MRNEVHIRTTRERSQRRPTTRPPASTTPSVRVALRPQEDYFTRMIREFFKGVV